MASVEQDVARHYAHGALGRIIAEALGEASGPELVTRLAVIDEFHMGGRRATARLAGQLELAPDHHVLDVGCGLGGMARAIATSAGCRVTGIDLTPEYVEVGQALNERARLAERITLRTASATDLPFEPAAFDRATMLHVGMNVADKRRVGEELARVVRPGGLVGIYDVMRTGGGALPYPMAWAQSESTSFVATPDEYRGALEAAGFEVVAEHDRREEALAFFARMQQRVAAQGLPPLGIHVLMGPDALAKVGNMVAAMGDGTIAPTEMIARRR